MVDTSTKQVSEILQLNTSKRSSLDNQTVLKNAMSGTWKLLNQKSQ